MADTIVNTPGGRDATDTAVGLVIAAVIALALVIGAVALFRNSTPSPAATTPAAIPNTGVDAGATSDTDADGTGTTDGGSSGGTGTGGTSSY